MPSDHLHNLNLGIAAIGTPPTTNERTLIVVGCGRGGTSVCAGCIDQLGIFTGTQSRDPIYEDTHLGMPIDLKDIETIETIARQYDSMHQIWAIKRPSIISILDQTKKSFRNPTYIFVFRDILAIGKRKSENSQSNLLENIKKAAREYDAILTFIENSNPYGLLVSYEKILRFKTEFIEQIVKLLGSPPIDPDRMKAAKLFISETPSKYLKSINNSKLKGHIDSITPNSIQGWACVVGQEEPASLEIFINGSPVAKVAANANRPDVKASGLHPNGQCGFKWEAGKDQELKFHDKITIQLEDSNLELPIPEIQGYTK